MKLPRSDSDGNPAGRDREYGLGGEAMTARADRHRTDATVLTVDDRELIEDMAKAIFDAFCSGVHSPMAREQYARQQRYKEAARAALNSPRLQSLLSERDKLEQLLERVWACRVDAQGRFINLEKLWPVIDDIGVALTPSAAIAPFTSS